LNHPHDLRVLNLIVQKQKEKKYSGVPVGLEGSWSSSFGKGGRKSKIPTSVGDQQAELRLGYDVEGGVRGNGPGSPKILEHKRNPIAGMRPREASRRRVEVWGPKKATLGRMTGPWSNLFNLGGKETISPKSPDQ